MIPSLEGWLTKAKVTPPHDVRLTPLGTNAVFGISFIQYTLHKK